MKFEIKDITVDFEDMVSVVELNDEAFPAEERIPASAMLEIAKLEYIDFCAVYDGNIFMDII